MEVFLKLRLDIYKYITMDFKNVFDCIFNVNSRF